jgi:hypothetical protein
MATYMHNFWGPDDARAVSVLILVSDFWNLERIDLARYTITSGHRG